mgnify:FL=1|jgi:hypothetical protein
MPHQSKRPFKRSFNLGIIQAAVLGELGLTIEEARQSLKVSRRVANQVFVEAVRQNFLWEKMTFSSTKGTGCVGVTLRKTKGALYDYVHVERQQGAFLTPLPCVEIEISRHRAKAILQAILTTPEMTFPIPSEVRIALGDRTKPKPREIRSPFTLQEIMYARKRKQLNGNMIVYTPQDRLNILTGAAGALTYSHATGFLYRP